jgi:hypothetical protein
VVRLRPQLRAQLPGPVVEPGRVRVGDQLHPPGRHPLRHPLHLCRGRASPVVRHVARRPRPPDFDLRGDALPHRGPAVRREPLAPDHVPGGGHDAGRVHRRQFVGARLFGGRHRGAQAGHPPGVRRPRPGMRER